MDSLLYLGLVLSLFVIVSADKERAIKVSDTGEGTECDADEEVAYTCLTCSRLDQVIAVPITVCCSESKAYSVCKICTKDPEGCLEDAQSISSEEFIDSSSSDDDMDVDKRYGRMFIGGWAYPARPSKRYGRMFFGGYPGSSYLFGGQKDKRFGRVFANGYGYPSRSFTSKIGKRYGRLFTSGGSKRYGSLFLGKGGW
jgi:hypothetical protein